MSTAATSDSKPSAKPRKKRSWRRIFVVGLLCIVAIAVIARVILAVAFPTVLRKVAAAYGLDASYSRMELYLLAGEELNLPLKLVLIPRHAFVRWDDGVCVTTNTVESFFSLLKRGVDGTFHHVSKKHLHRYLSEFDFRYNNRGISDSDRREVALQQFEGKRLMYKEPISRDADNLTGKSSDD